MFFSQTSISEVHYINNKIEELNDFKRKRKEKKKKRKEKYSPLGEIRF